MIDIFSTLFGILASTENFTEIVPGNPSVGGGGLNAKDVAKYSDFGLIEGYILETMQDRAVS